MVGKLTTTGLTSEMMMAWEHTNKKDAQEGGWGAGSNEVAQQDNSEEANNNGNA